MAKDTGKLAMTTGQRIVLIVGLLFTVLNVTYAIWHPPDPLSVFRALLPQGSPLCEILLVLAPLFGGLILTAIGFFLARKWNPVLDKGRGHKPIVSDESDESYDDFLDRLARKRRERTKNGARELEDRRGE